MKKRQQQSLPDFWTLFDQHRMRIYGGEFGSEHEAWQGRDKALLPSHIVPKRRSDAVIEDRS
jgi:hypothetical protein